MLQDCQLGSPSGNLRSISQVRDRYAKPYFNCCNQYLVHLLCCDSIMLVNVYQFLHGGGASQNCSAYQVRLLQKFFIVEIIFVPCCVLVELLFPLGMKLQYVAIYYVLETHLCALIQVADVHLVTDPWTRESRGFGFVTMSTVEEANRCIKYLDRSVLEGRVITVEKVN